MKEKILAALKTQYKDLGFGASALAGVSHYLAKNVVREEEIEGAIQDVKELLKIFQSDTDLRVQRAVVKAKAQVQEKRTDATKNKCSDLKSVHTSKQKTENKKGGEASKKRTHGFMKPVDKETTESYQVLLDTLAKQRIEKGDPENKVPKEAHNITVICVEGDNYTVSIQSKKKSDKKSLEADMIEYLLRRTQV
ncbi:hypothetical protein ABE426_14475 [Sphingobacterium faecium]|uniref:hypothetical protein n=1 Tax=Sphingobacterium faecium TaxID=34087 RepID=UPI00320988DD